MAKEQIQLSVDPPKPKTLNRTAVWITISVVLIITIYSFMTWQQSQKPKPKKEETQKEEAVTQFTPGSSNPIQIGEKTAYGPKPPLATTKSKFSDESNDKIQLEEPDNEGQSNEGQKSASENPEDESLDEENGKIQVQAANKEEIIKKAREIARRKGQANQTQMEKDAIESEFLVVTITSTANTAENIPSSKAPKYNLPAESSNQAIAMPQLPIPQNMDPVASQNMQNEKKDFLNAPNVQKTSFSAIVPQEPVSPYELKVGTILPGVLIDGVNSDLPGTLRGQIREDVYDTVTGQHLLVPRGTRLVGEYDSMLSYDQDRILVVWTTLELPDGRMLDLQRMPGVDMSGMAGQTGKVNRYFWRKAASVILASIFDAAAATAVRDETSLWQKATEGATTQTNQAVQNLATKAFNRQNTVTIKAGQRFAIIVKTDLIIPPKI